MDYQIALSPDLDLSSDDFIAAWNDIPECRDVAEARLAKPTSAQYDPFTVAAAALSSVALGVTASALYDLIKKVLAKKDITKQIEIIQIEQPDGHRLLIVKTIGE